MGGSGHGRDGGKPTTPTLQSQPEGLVPKGGSGGTRKYDERGALRGFWSV
jgi:hypothetical protein